MQANVVNKDDISYCFLELEIQGASYKFLDFYMYSWNSP